MIEHICLFPQNRDFFGAVLQHIPLLHSLRTSYPNASIKLLTPVAQSRLLLELGLADELELIQKTTIGLAARLRRDRPDLVITLRPTSTWITCAARLSGAGARVGFCGPLSDLMLTHTRERDRRIYRAENYSRLLCELVPAEPLDAGFVKLAGEASGHRGDAPYFCLIPGGGTGTFKRWPIGGFLAVGGRLQARVPGCRFIFLLGDKERDYQPVIESSPIAAASRILINASIGACGRIASESLCVISNDCGPCHIAQMIGAPYVGLFSDHDGKAKEVVTEWFLSRPNATWISGAPLAPIDSIGVDQVCEAVDCIIESAGVSR